MTHNREKKMGEGRGEVGKKRGRKRTEGKGTEGVKKSSFQAWVPGLNSPPAKRLLRLMLPAAVSRNCSFEQNVHCLPLPSKLLPKRILLTNLSFNPPLHESSLVFSIKTRCATFVLCRKAKILFKRTTQAMTCKRISNNHPKIWRFWKLNPEE